MEKARYIEPADYIPEEIRKKYKVGEYAEPDGTGETDETDGDPAKQ